MKVIKTTFFCDRCGGDASDKKLLQTDEHGNRSPYGPEAFIVFGHYRGSSPDSSKRQDLCIKCHDDLVNWFNADCDNAEKEGGNP